MATVGAVLGARRPRHPVGWFMLALGLSVTLDGVTDSYARYGLLASPGAVPAVGQVACSGTRSPSGRPASASSCCSRRPARCRRPAGDGGPGSPSWRHCCGRRRPSSGSRRQSSRPSTRSGTRTSFPPWGHRPSRWRCPRSRSRCSAWRWVASAAAVAAASIPVAVAGISINSPAVVGVAVLGSAVVLCLAIAAAILRYRLYDLNRVISRTVAYGLLTVLLGLGYAAVALGLGGLLGRDSSLSVAAFGTRLRDQVDLDTLTGELLTVVATPCSRPRHRC